MGTFEMPACNKPFRNTSKFVRSIIYKSTAAAQGTVLSDPVMLCTAALTMDSLLELNSSPLV